MFVALPIEIKSRELDSRLYIAAKLLQRNVKCVIGYKPEVNDYCYSYGGRYVYLGKSVSLNSYKRIKETGGKFTVLDEEGGVYAKDYASSLNLRVPDSVLGHVDTYFSWGSIQRNFLLDNRKNITKSRILVSGNPRFDLSKAEFSSYHMAISKEKNHSLNDYILISTRFKRYNHQLGDDGQGKFTKHMETNKATMLMKNKLYSDERSRRDRDYQAELFLYFIEAIKELSSTFKGQVIVVRPHPTENIETYESIFSNFTNVHVSREGAIFEWITNAKLVIHHDCTTGVESMVHGLPTISYTPIYDEGLTQWLPISAGLRVNTKSKLIATVKKYVVDNYDKGYFLDKYDMTLIKKFIANIDFDSAEFIASSLVKNIDLWSKSEWSVAREERDNKKKLATRLIHKLKKISDFGTPIYRERQQVKQLKRNKFSTLSSIEVEGKINALLEMPLSSNKINIKISPINDNSYLLEKNVTPDEK